jgi:adenine-specific DNA-methyltransferase
MAKIDITKTELVWPGKYNEDGTRKEVPRVNLPFQVIETVNESRATREAQKTKGYGLFDTYEAKEGDTFEAGWRNKLIWGDNLVVMGSLLEKFEGKVDLIYIDPPFATGADFSFKTQIGDSDIELSKEQSIIEEKAYRDTWGLGSASYLEMMHQRFIFMRELLSDKGLIYVHCDSTMSHYLKLLLDDVFGQERFLNDVIWSYQTRHSSERFWNRKHDNLLHYSKGDKWIFNWQDPDVMQQLSPETIKKYRLQDEKGPYRLCGRFLKDSPIKGAKDVDPKWEKTNPELVVRDYLRPGIPPNDSFFLPMENQSSADRTDYATQKPTALLNRLVKASSAQGGLVADFFCGSGTTLAVAEKLGRRWIGCDLGRWGIHVTRKRLLGIENCKPFEVLNLGKYERQYWQGVTFGDAKNKPLTEQALYDYLAFILKLYGAQPISGLSSIHGKKGKALIHIGAVDAPVTISEIDTAIDECAKLRQGDLHVLGWEWEMGLYDLMVEAAKKKGVKLLLLQIPREVMEQQAADKGDVRFFELAYLEAEIKQPKKLTTQVALKDFVIPNTELIPEEVRSKVKKWSDYIDYWAVDWDFQNDTFMQGWVAYRTRQERKLPLTSDVNTYKKPGKYRILVKVIDIFGNDTSQAFDVEVK